MDFKLPTRRGALFPQGPCRIRPHESGNRRPADLKHRMMISVAGATESYMANLDPGHHELPAGELTCAFHASALPEIVGRLGRSTAADHAVAEYAVANDRQHFGTLP